MQRQSRQLPGSSERQYLYDSSSSIVLWRRDVISDRILGSALFHAASSVLSPGVV